MRMAWIYNGKTSDESLVLLYAYFFIVLIFTLVPVIMLCVCMIHWCADHYPIFSNERVGDNDNRSTQEINLAMRQERALRILS